MNILAKLKETTLSVLPIILIVFVLHLSIAPLGWQVFGGFVIASLFIILGLSLFLTGIDIGILPTGELIGSKLTSKRNLPLLLVSALIIGTVATIAEPDVIVLADQITSVDSSIPRLPLIIMVSVGIGMMMLIGFLRIVLSLSYHVILIISFTILFVLAAIARPEHVAMAFDSGGMATGPLVVPFIMAMGIGVAAIRSNSTAEEDSFGLVGLCTIGPVAAVLILSLFTPGTEEHSAIATTAAEQVNLFGQALGPIIKDTIVQVALALFPLIIIFMIFHFLIIHMSKFRLIKMFEGLAYAFIGLILFLVGVNGSFVPIGRELGFLAATNASPPILIIIAFFLGAVIVLAEPSVWVLANQVAEISGGRIARKTLLISLSIGVAIASSLSMLRVITGFSIWLLLLPGYGIALLLARFSPKLFTSIAFDSGTVASGPMSCTFILALFLGTSQALKGNPATDAFGLVSMIVLLPIITVESLGVLYSIKEKKLRRLSTKSQDGGK
ncbi:MAG: DUF1538 domain-containing protein [Sphaerochaetaceae bacterium]|nr:DUF1538 domain-containing protein [Sphaerochaetaceae bacterium]